METYYQPEASKSVPGQIQVLHVANQGTFLDSSKGPLDHFCGPIGYVPSCSNSQGIKEVPPVCPQRSGLPVQGPRIPIVHTCSQV